MAIGHGGFGIRHGGLAARVCSLLDLCFQFANYDKTYGSLGAVIILLLWLYISFYIILLGAEINAELELQTAVDTTTGRPKPMGKRGAFVADHVAGGPQDDRHPSSPVTRDPTAAKPGGS
jgi:membrane protein